ncbi:unnamed protein product [Cuscuta europaea]|uniref:Uncharacterized protein n=1 Tax=Cuscuta europaea TaxID=41803 RepID=A0A9P0Z9D8_CUSEU|nr:unnamed protein product [Cuscuta europaea]
MDLEVQGFKTSAIGTMDVALSPLAAKSLSESERAEALHKRATLRIATSLDGEFNSAIADLVDSVWLKGDDVKARCLLGECYEKKELKVEAQKCYEDALKVQPDYSPALVALSRLAA